MSDSNAQTPPGWYYAAGDPPGTQRYWDGSQWQGGPQPVAAGGPGGMAAGGMTLANPGSRLLARIVDVLVLLIPLIIVGAALGQGWFATLVTFLLVAAYEVYLLGTRGATIGKSVMNVKVVNEDYSDINMEIAVRRYAINAVGLVPGIGQFINLLVFIASIIMIFTDSQRQVVWDKIAKTLVISTK